VTLKDSETAAFKRMLPDNLDGSLYTPPSSTRFYTASSSATSTYLRLVCTLLALVLGVAIFVAIFKRNFAWTRVLVMMNTVIFSITSALFVGIHFVF
jgi:hypothetical protein